MTMPQTDDHARQIYQQLLDDIGSAIVAQDKARYISYFLLPHRLETFEKSVDITDAAMLGTYFDKMVERLLSIGVSELTRHCTLAKFVDDTTIRGYHQSKLINKALVIVEDYTALSTLIRVGPLWKVSASQYAEAQPALPTRITE